MTTNTTKTSKYAKAAMKHIATGRSVEDLVSWWNRLVDYAEVKDGKVIFYLNEAVPASRGGWRFTGRKYIDLELPIW
jgi:hypothetical protein